MAIILFIIVGASGFASTTLILNYASERGHSTHHQYALILAFGFGLTWLLSFFVPLLASGLVEIKPSLVLFWVVHSILVAIITYGVARIGLIFKSRSEL